MARLTLVVALAAVVAASPADAWLRRIAGSHFVVDDEAVAMALDSQGHAVVVSASVPDPGPCRVTASKRDGRTGRTLWERSLGRCLYGRTAAVAVDAADDVVVGLPGFVLVKLASATGEVLWRNEPGPDVKWSSGYVDGIVVDPAGDVVAAGDGVFNPFDDEDHDFAVVKVRGATGASVWHFSINGAFAPCPPDDDFCHDDVYPFDAAYAITLDAGGRVVVGGEWDHYLNGGFIVVALDGASGAEAWRYVAGGGSVATLLATPDAIYAGGDAAQGSIVVRLDPATGHERWVRPLGPGIFGGGVGALSLHRSGDVLAAGQVPAGGVAEPFVARLRPAQGEVAWRGAIPSPSQSGQVQRLALAPGDDDTVAVLTSTVTPVSPPDEPPTGAAISLLDARTGDVAWRTPLAGSDGGGGRAWALAARMDGDFVVAGGVRNVDTGLDATVARLRAGDGSAVWRVEQNGEPAGDDHASAVATDAAGDAFVVGSVQNASRAGGADLAVVKLARGTGAELWRREIDGTGFFGSTFDGGSDVTLDPAGNPIVAAQLGDQATLLAFDGATGAERWRTSLPYDGVFNVRLDAQNDVVALLYRRFADPVATVVKLDGASGAERWRRPLDVGSRRSAATLAATVTRDGTVVTVSYGYDDATQVFDGVVVALASGDGTERWRRVLPDTLARTVATDADGRVVLGFDVRGNSTESDAAVALLDPATGVELRRTIVLPPALRPSAATSLAFDAAGGVLVGGFAGPGGAFVARLDTRGEVAWRRAIPPTDRRLRGRHVAGVTGLAVHRDGVVLGFTLYSDERWFDWVLVGLGRSGALRWLRTLDGDETPSPDLGDRDDLTDLTTTPQGDVVAVGNTSWVASGNDFTVLALRGRTGGDRLRFARERCSGGGAGRGCARPTLDHDARSGPARADDACRDRRAGCPRRTARK